MRSSAFAFSVLLACPPFAVAGESGPVCLPYTSNAACTAQDVELFDLAATEVIDGCVDAADTATVRLRATMSVNGPDRYDVALFLAMDGGAAKGGESCYHEYLAPPLTADPVYQIDGEDGRPVISDGPWPDLDGDSCGDMERTVNAANPKSILTVPTSPGSLVIACRDSDSNGLVDLDFCTSWSAFTTESCTQISEAVPATQARCFCEYSNIAGLPATGATTTTTTTTTIATTTTTIATTTTTLAGAGSPIAAAVLVVKPGKVFKIVATEGVPDPAGDPVASGAVLAFSGTSGGAAYTLPASCWRSLGDGKGYACKDAACPSVRIGGGKLKAVCKGDTGSFALPDSDVAVSLDIGTSGEVCALCGGEASGNPDAVFKRKACPSPASCP